MKMTDNSVKSAVPAWQESWLETVRSQVASLRFGVVRIDVRDSEIVQIERAERVRLDKPPTGNTQPPARNLEA